MNLKRKNITSNKREMKDGKTAKFLNVYLVQKKIKTEERFWQLMLMKHPTKFSTARITLLRSNLEHVMPMLQVCFFTIVNCGP